MSTRTETICDIKGCAERADHKQKLVSVVFTTEQTEGRSVPPYLSGEKLDFCTKHYQQYINTLPLWAEGASGYNHYEFGSKTR
jgi:endo-beta-N-acetylglucosaminidase D